MSVIKCKMCGGTVDFNPGETVGVCDFCGTKQTLPKANDEVITNLFNRANNLRLKCEFDKAEQIYEKIVQQDDSEAEAHWGIILCKYGIEYVEDPKTFERVPTCHRTRFESIKTDADYEAAVDYADTLQQSIYEKEARAIDKLQKDILAIVKNEKPFDVFICYKETDDSGRRTVDSTLANDIYHQLTQNGLKVFYAAITLDDKLGQEYEPYIFAALNSAKVMLVIGTKPEYFTAVWVKNEWLRFMNLMKTDRSKILIPCYRDMDAYDLPEEFAHLQAQDMSRIGFIQDIIRGVEKVVGNGAKAQTQAATVGIAAGPNVNALLKRAYMFLEDGNWEEADNYCERVLDQDPENALAYLGKLMAQLHVHQQADLEKIDKPFDENGNYKKAIRFAEEELKTKLQGYITSIKSRWQISYLKERIFYVKNEIDNSLTLDDLNQLEKLLGDDINNSEIKKIISNAREDYERRIPVAIGLWEDYLLKKVESDKRASELYTETSIYEKHLSKIADLKKELNSIHRAEKDIHKLHLDIQSASEIIESLENDLEYEKEKLRDCGLFAISAKKDANKRIDFIQIKIGHKKWEIEELEEKNNLLQKKIEESRAKGSIEQEIMSLKGETIRFEQELADANEKSDKAFMILSEASSKVVDTRILSVLISSEDVELLQSVVSDSYIVDVINGNPRLLEVLNNNPNVQYVEPIKKLKRKKGKGLDAEATYFQACQAMENSMSAKDIIWAKEQFNTILGYKDSASRLEECSKMLVFNKELVDMYQKALELERSGEINEAYTLFMELGSYKDSFEHAEACKRRFYSDSLT